ncbi:MAG: biotin/lipoyl-binding protein, partial [bacterium]|nr:biotin/lipoyl-binding protein [bacterium]
HVAAQTAGVLAQIRVREGSHVKQGQLLAQLDDQDAQRTLKAIAGATASLSAKELALRAAVLEAEHSEYVLARIQQASERSPGSVPDSEVKGAEHAVKRAKLSVEIAQAEYHSAKQVREVELENADREVKRHRVVAVNDGVVAEVFRHRGERVKEGEPICRVVRLDRLRAEAFLHIADHAPADIKGRNAIIEVRTARGKVQRVDAKVSFVSPNIESGGEYRFWVEFDNLRKNGQPIVLPGQTATVRVKMDSPPPCDSAQVENPAELIWDALGVKLRRLSPDQLADNFYRGGMQVTEIRKDGP